MSYLTFLRRNPTAGLLTVQLLGVVLYPLMESSPRSRTLFGVFGLLVLGRRQRVAAPARLRRTAERGRRA